MFLTNRLRRFGAAVAFAACIGMGSAGCSTPIALADHHQHVFSPDVAAMLSTPERPFEALDAGQVIDELDRAGIARAVLLSVGYLYEAPGRNFDDAPARVRAENDWTAAQAAAHPSRLVAFCGVNPLSNAALAELARCAASPGLRRGIKLHFGNSDVQLDDPVHLAKVQRVFAAANDHRMAIVVHLRASISRQRPYGAAQVRRFLDEVMPSAADVPVQVAHFAGSGPGFEDAAARAARGEFAAAVERGEASTKRLWFDVASIVDAGIAPETAEAVVGFIRRVGPARVLFGSDAAVGANLRPAEAWAAFRRLPLTRAELATIANNLAPYLR
ncbi:MAG: amidohydrolase family protein [Burkholderiaceae bacterium]